jgi:hypothetical protein
LLSKPSVGGSQQNWVVNKQQTMHWLAKQAKTEAQ